MAASDLDLLPYYWNNKITTMPKTTQNDDAVIEYPSHKELDMEKYRRIVEAGNFDQMFNYGFDVGKAKHRTELEEAKVAIMSAAHEVEIQDGTIYPKVKTHDLARIVGGNYHTRLKAIKDEVRREERERIINLAEGEPYIYVPNITEKSTDTK